MEDIGLRSMTVLMAVADRRSFRAAAEDLGLSPSSVSHMIGSLEDRLGIRLLHRSTRSVALTEAGEAFLARIRPALAEIGSAVAGIHDLRDRPAGQIRINASEWGAERLLPLVLAFQRTHPEVRVDLLSEGRIVDIIAEGFDAGLRLEGMVPQDMVAISLSIPEYLILVAHPAYLAARGTPMTPGDLLAHDCIRARLPSGQIMGWEMRRGAQLAEPKVTGRLILGSTALSAEAAAAGAGIAYVAEREAAGHLTRGDLVQIMADWTPPLGSEALYYPPSRLHSAAFRAFVAFLRANRGQARP